MSSFYFKKRGRYATIGSYKFEGTDKYNTYVGIVFIQVEKEANKIEKKIVGEIVQK